MAGSNDVKRALLTGVTGQDGAYLARFLLDKGYEVHGIKRHSSSFNTGRIEDIYQDPHDPEQRFVLHHGDLTDATWSSRLSPYRSRYRAKASSTAGMFFLATSRSTTRHGRSASAASAASATPANLLISIVS